MKNSHRQRGASLPETVIVMGVLLALMFGIVDFGRALYTYSFVAQLARQGARWIIVRGADCSVLDHCNASSSCPGTNDLQTYVRSLSEGATPNTITACATYGTTACNTSHTPGCTVTVTVSYPFTFMVPYITSAGISMSSSSTMVVAN